MPDNRLTTRRFGSLTYREISECARQGWLAIVPTGCTEQQGPHLPVDFDSWFAEHLMLTVAEKMAREYRVESLVLAALPFGPAPEHRNFGSGYIDIPVSLHNALVEATLSSLFEQGFRRIVLWQGCGGHDLAEVVKRFNQLHPEARVFLPNHPYYAIWCRVGDEAIPTGHADSFTTSISLYLRPETVRLDQISDPHSTAVNWSDPQLDFTNYSSTGVIGDPTHGSTELGKQLWEAVVTEVAKTLQSYTLVE